MQGTTIHQRLRTWRYAAFRQAKFRAVYAHAVMVAHMEGRLIADDHPSWSRIDSAIKAAQAGDPDALARIERELLRLRDKNT
ncbi:hypothetical protein BVG79_01138 [Ketogulonicigenium robustum]|uniref:Uncharacterized protein n=1 Tax=Ketogulonicigenium robustum TaxID=92947 RepID=A0A1W6NZ57_9RHOB|nr:hypothetical protein [Ketogulonicigenium robustum]ARO14484.1 hypothetical protein BVG79_01138 [Ketogulonicigenium robustum]